MARMRHMPMPATKEAVLQILDAMRAGVEADDSWEGFIEYSMPDEGDLVMRPDGVEALADYMVVARYRVGNRNGQGGMRMIGQMVEVTDERPLAEAPAQ